MTPAHDKTDAAASARSTTDDADDIPPADAPTDIVVIVVRTGGLAGLRREWRAEPPATAEPRWIALIERCPWDDAVGDSRGSDRFTWHIHVRFGRDERDVELPEQAVQGPWRELVDGVRDVSATPAPAPSPAPGVEPRPPRR